MSIATYTMRQAAASAMCLALAAGLVSVWGCATSDEAELTRLLQELDGVGRTPAHARPAVSMPSEPAPVAAVVPPTTAPPTTASEPTSVTVSVPDEAASEVAQGPRQSTGPGLTIQPDCIVQISVAEDPSLNGSYPVNEIGAVDIGYIGPVILYNRSEKDAAEKIRDVLLQRDFLTATVKVRILKPSYGKVKVIGSVRQPGQIKVGAGDTISLNDALLRAGGLSASAWGGTVRVYRGGLLSAIPDAGPYEDFPLLTEGGQPRVPDIQLGNNDVASVMPPMAAGSESTGQPLGEKEILVLGEVGKPGFYRFEGSEPCTMLHLLFRLGELPKFANTKAIKVIRRDGEGRENEILVDAARILGEGRPEDDVQLENGDRVIIPEKTFSIL